MESNDIRIHEKNEVSDARNLYSSGGMIRLAVILTVVVTFILICVCFDIYKGLQSDELPTNEGTNLLENDVKHIKKYSDRRPSVLKSCGTFGKTSLDTKHENNPGNSLTSPLLPESSAKKHEKLLKYCRMNHKKCKTGKLCTV
ncbi:UNVERIFIED_CONTAM: hypothetical protein RMT77_019303 [Armadillidium vulgare]|nr:hypothetical protein Avbf_13870 [Armadillidium vulgare]